MRRRNYARYPAQPWSDLVDGMQTGDLILFSGVSSESEWIKLFTGGQFSHSTMIYRPDPTQPPLMWQEAPEAIVPDPHTGTSHSGAQLGDAKQATIEINTAYKDVPYYVKLNWDRPSTLNATMLKVLTQYEETPFGSVLQMALNYALGHLYGQATEQDFIYCAELVALTFQAIDVLDGSHPANWYSPIVLDRVPSTPFRGWAARPSTCPWKSCCRVVAPLLSPETRRPGPADLSRRIN